MLVSISGPSGVGKTTVIKELLLLDSRFVWQPSYTTRKMRLGEKDGFDYHFIDILDWHSMESNDNWILSTNHDGCMYGYRASVLQQYIRSSSVLILNIDQSGAKELRSYDPTCRNILITADNNHIIQRLHNRGEPEGSERYRQSSVWDVGWYHCTVVNDTLAICVASILQYIQLNINEL